MRSYSREDLNGPSLEDFSTYSAPSAQKTGILPSTSWTGDIKHSASGFAILVVQSLSHVQLFATSWTTSRQAPVSSTASQSFLRFISIELVMLYNYLILSHSLLFLPSIFPIIMVFSSESALCIRWPKDWSFSFSISPPMNIQDWFPLGLTDLIFLKSSPMPQFKNINSSALSLKN